MSETSPTASERVVASGDGWRVVDVVCTAGPDDRPFEEERRFASVSAVIDGLFTYAGSEGRAMMPAGSLLLGNAGVCYACGHRHARGDRCVAFQFDAGLLDAAARRHGRGVGTSFAAARLSPSPAIAPLIDRARRLAGGEGDAEMLAGDMLAAALTASSGVGERRPTPADDARVGRALAFLAANSAAPLDLDRLATEAGVSRWHFLRLFRAVTGVTPYRYLLGFRLAAAARRLDAGPGRVIDIALDCGFSDLSEFTRAFRHVYGRPPAAYRRRPGHI